MRTFLLLSRALRRAVRGAAAAAALGASLAGGAVWAQPAEVPAGPLTLEAAVAAAVKRNERAQAASARAEAAEARVQRAQASFLPQLSVSTTYNRRQYQTVRQVGDQQVVLQRYDALGASANLTAPILNARAFPLYKQAAMERQASAADARESARLLAFEAADAFLATLSGEQVRTAAERRLAFAQQALKESRARVQAKLVSSNDATRAELEVATAEREATRARGDVQSAYLQLANLLNMPVTSQLEEPAGLLEAAARAHEEREIALEPVLARRLDLQALRSRAEGAEAYAAEPGLRMLPQLNLLGQYRLTNEGGLTGRFGDGYVGLELSWTLFDAGTRYAERRERDALARATALDASALERSVGLQLERARVNLRNAQASLEQAKVAAQAAEKNAQEAQVLYREGLTGALQLADANIRLFEAQVALARERYGLALALLDVRAAAGLDPLGKEWKL